MSYTRLSGAAFGKGKTGLSTVGYRLYNADNTPNGPRITAGVTESVVPGSYGATVTYPNSFVGKEVWDTGEGTPAYAEKIINPGESEYLDTNVGSRLAPTTTGRTLDVSATGEAGVDWANVGSPTSAQNLSGTSISTAQVVARVSGDVDGKARGGGSSTLQGVAALVDVQAWDGETPPSLNGDGNFSVDVATWKLGVPADLDGDRVPAALLVTPPTVGAIADAVWDEATAGHQTAGTTGKQLTDNGDVTDPMLNDIGGYPPGSLGYQLQILVPGTAINVVSPMAEDGTLTLMAGAVYETGHSTPIPLGTLDSTAPDMRTTTSAVVTLHCYTLTSKRVSIFDHLVTVTGPRDAQVLSIPDMSTEESNDLLGHLTDAGRWDAIAVYPDGNQWPAKRGRLVIQLMQGTN